MGFYDLSKDERKEFLAKMKCEIEEAFVDDEIAVLLRFASDEDTYIRKSCYLSIGKIYKGSIGLREKIMAVVKELYDNEEEKIRQTAVYAMGEIGKVDADAVFPLFENAFEDAHHSVRNGVIGALKQMCSKNSEPTLQFIRSHLDTPNPETRRELIHGIELRGREHPEEILPILKECQFEQNKRVRKMIVHVLGQISYKTKCLQIVVEALLQWENRELVEEAVQEIYRVNINYERFSAMAVIEVRDYLNEKFGMALE